MVSQTGSSAAQENEVRCGGHEDPTTHPLIQSLEPRCPDSRWFNQPLWSPLLRFAIVAAQVRAQPYTTLRLHPGPR